MTTWNKYMEDILKKWSSTAKTYSIMHSIAARHYNKWNNGLGIPVILLGAVTSSSIFTTATANDPDNIWTYINGGLVLLTTGLTGLSKFLGVNEKEVKHTTASFKYTSISMNIDTILSFPRNYRQEEPRKFINEIKLAILEVREHSPNLPTWILTNYINKMDKTIVNTGTKVNRHIDKKQWNANTQYRTVDSTSTCRSNVYTVPRKISPRTLECINKPYPNSVNSSRTLPVQPPTTPAANVSPFPTRKNIDTNDVKISVLPNKKDIKVPLISPLPLDNVNEDYSYLDPLSEKIATVSQNFNYDSESESSESNSEY